MKTLFLAAGLCAALAVAALWLWRMSDHRVDRRIGAALAATQPASPDRFDPAMVAGLPDPARQYFRFAIRPGTSLYTVAEIEMTGRFGLGTREAPNYMAMKAHQVLAAPEGFVLQVGRPVPLSR